jgi:FAD/FMN-containing dehydrogenase
MSSVSPDLLDRFAAIVGDKYALRGEADLAPHLIENRGLYRGASPMLLKPANVQEVSAILKLASETGTCRRAADRQYRPGRRPDAARGEIRHHSVAAADEQGPRRRSRGQRAGRRWRRDPPEVQKAAEAHGRLFPLSLGSEGSCRIGGNLSTNAGGTAVLAYGNMRQLCLGLEVVLPTGEIWDGLKPLKKDNTGYDLRDLFIGAEGTLGIITGAVLKLFPQPLGQQVAFAGLNSVEDALALFNAAKPPACAARSLTGFELMPRSASRFTARHIDGVRDPLETAHAWYVLIDISARTRPKRRSG